MFWEEEDFANYWLFAPEILLINRSSSNTQAESWLVRCSQSNKQYKFTLMLQAKKTKSNLEIIEISNQVTDTWDMET